MDNTVRAGRVPTSRIRSGKVIRCTPAVTPSAGPPHRQGGARFRTPEWRQVIGDDSEPATSGSDDFCCKRGHVAILPSHQFLPRASSCRCANGVLNPSRERCRRARGRCWIVAGGSRSAQPASASGLQPNWDLDDLATSLNAEPDGVAHTIIVQRDEEARD